VGADDDNLGAGTFLRTRVRWALVLEGDGTAGFIQRRSGRQHARAM